MSKQTIKFDQKTKRFRRAGRYVSKSSGMRSAIAREQYYTYYPSRRPGYLSPKKRPEKTAASIVAGRWVYKRKTKRVYKKRKTTIQIQPEPKIGYGFEIRDLYAESEIEFNYDDLYTDYGLFDSEYWQGEFENIDLDDEDKYGDDNV